MKSTMQTDCSPTVVRLTQGCAMLFAISFTEADRALHHHQSLELVAEGEESSVPPADDHNHGVTTVIVPAATPRQEVSAAQQKKNRDREYQRKKRAGTGRGRSGTISDDESVTSSRRPTKRSRLTDD